MEENKKEDFVGDIQFSGGDIVDKQRDLKLLEERTKEYAPDKNLTKKKISKKEMEKGLKKINDILNTNYLKKIPQPYYFMQFWGDYFCNTIDFKTDNPDLADNIIKTIRNAFINGSSGIYCDKKMGKVYAINIVDVRYNQYNEIKSIKYSNINRSIKFTGPDKKPGTIWEVSGDEVKNIYIFNWGTNAYSVWITLWPFINQQVDILKMIIMEQFTHIKKIAYSIANPEQFLNELELFLNLNNPFLIIFDDTFQNKFEILDFKNADMLSTITYYKEFEKIICGLTGKRINEDVKNQANITGEVRASQEQYDLLQNNYKAQFKIFIMKLNQNEMINGAIELDAPKYKDDEFDKDGEQGESKDVI